MDEHLRVAGRLKDRAAPNQLLAQRHRVGDVAVVRDCEAAGGELREQRLHVPQRRLAGGGIAHMTRRHPARQRADHLVAVKRAGNVPHRSVGMERRAVIGRDARRLLPTMLQRVQAERDNRCSGVIVRDAEHAALLVQPVVVERMGGQHGCKADVGMRSAVAIGCTCVTVFP